MLARAGPVRQSPSTGAGRWDRAALETNPDRLRHPPAVTPKTASPRG